MLIVAQESGDSLGVAEAGSVLFLLGLVTLHSLRHVASAVGGGRVVRAALVGIEGGPEVFVDRCCDQLRALPDLAAAPACPSLFTSWLSTPAWAVAPAVAMIKEVEYR